jgi:cytochrome c biogenesis protein CcdA
MKPIAAVGRYCWPLCLIFLLGATQSSIFFSDNRWDFGTVHSQQSLRKEITITNRGAKMVHAAITGTCDCLRSVPPELNISPGEKASVMLHYNPAEDSGQVRKYFMITTDDPGLERVLFLLEGTVNAGRSAETPWVSPPTPANLETPKTASAISLVFYYTPGCKKCDVFLHREIPRLEKELTLKITVKAKDILKPDIYAEYYQSLTKLGKTPKALPVVLIEDTNTVLQGEPEIRGQLAGFLKKAETQTNLKSSWSGTEKKSRQSTSTKNLGRNLYVFPVILAGLLDGINPCAFTTLIFLLSYLAFMGRNRREILSIGISFSLAVFVTYYFIGLGLFRVLEFTQLIPWMNVALNWLLLMVLAAFSVLSLVDYFKIKSGKSSELILQLPDRFKRSIHRSIRTQAKSTALIASSLTLGFLVSVFELACTGQVYFPTIAYLVQAKRQFSAFLMLGVYNLGFIVPLLLVFYLTYTGIQSQRFAEIFRNNLAKVKLGLAIFFLGLAVLVFFT